MPSTRVSHVTVTCIRVSCDLVCTAAEHVHKYVDGHDLSKEFDESVASHTKVCILHVHVHVHLQRLQVHIHNTCTRLVHVHVRGVQGLHKWGRRLAYKQGYG